MVYQNSTSELAITPIGKLLVRFAIPSILAQLVNLLYNIVDRIFVGRIPEVGPLALADLVFPFPLFLLFQPSLFLLVWAELLLLLSLWGRETMKRPNAFLVVPVYSSCLCHLYWSFFASG